VTAFAGGKKAIVSFMRKTAGQDLARQKLPDLIVTDLTMPGIDGFGWKN
jgi:CheY-like chemotaxis protein